MSKTVDDMGSRVDIQRPQLIFDLESYGEESLARRVEAEWGIGLAMRIGEVAYHKLKTENLISKAVALAAVEVMEGEARELKRKRRKNLKNWPETDLP